jgi:hypothetical protein
MMKYICFEDEDGKQEIITFPNSINHDCLAQSIDHMRNQTHGNWYRVGRDPVSAGFVYDDLTCHGRSETLNLDSRPEDTLLLRSQY